MKLKARNIVQLILFVVVIILLYFFLEPGIPRFFTPQYEQNGTNDFALIIEQKVDSEITLYYPEYIARMFGWEAEIPPTPTPTVTPTPTPTPVVIKPIQAEFLSYISFIVNEAGEKSYFFKDRRVNKIFDLKPGETKGTWTLEVVSSAYFILSDGKNKYEVAR